MSVDLASAFSVIDKLLFVNITITQTHLISWFDVCRDIMRYENTKQNNHINNRITSFLEDKITCIPIT